MPIVSIRIRKSCSRRNRMLPKRDLGTLEQPAAYGAVTINPLWLFFLKSETMYRVHAGADNFSVGAPLAGWDLRSHGVCVWIDCVERYSVGYWSNDYIPTLVIFHTIREIVIIFLRGSLTSNRISTEIFACLCLLSWTKSRVPAFNFKLLSDTQPFVVCRIYMELLDCRGKPRSLKVCALKWCCEFRSGLAKQSKVLYPAAPGTR